MIIVVPLFVFVVAEKW